MKIPYLIPYINYEIKSSRGKEEILERFNDSTYIVRTLSMTTTRSHQEFEGVLRSDGFDIRRLFKIGYSAFLPILSCDIREEENNVSLKVNIQFHNYVTIFLIVFFLFQIPIFTLDLTNIVIFIVPYLVVMFLFNWEVRFLKEKLNSIVRSE